VIARPPRVQVTRLASIRRVAAELIVVDSARRPGIVAEGSQERVLDDGSRHRVFKRYLLAAQLAGEIGGQILLDGDWFIAARVPATPTRRG
jgi:hypothetical protein